jgi:putative transposase
MIIPIMAVSDQHQPRQTSQAKLSARRELVRSVEEGMTAREARRRCLVPMHRTTVYRLLKHVEREGEQALAERRHGHPTKLCGEVLTFLLDYCQSHASATSREIQRLVAERFDLSVSVSQLNRVRAAHGLSRKNPPQEKKAENGRHYCLWIS